jgi:hypothetical protein
MKQILIWESRRVIYADLDAARVEFQGRYHVVGMCQNDMIRSLLT